MTRQLNLRRCVAPLRPSSRRPGDPALCDSGGRGRPAGLGLQSSQRAQGLRAPDAKMPAAHAGSVIYIFFAGVLAHRFLTVLVGVVILSGCASRPVSESDQALLALPYWQFD